MKFYSVRPDSNNVQLVMPKDINDFSNGKLEFGCEPHTSWQPLDMYIYNPKTKPKGFFSLGSSCSVLVFNEKVLDKMFTIFEMAGEILTLKVHFQQVYLLNVLECINSLNSELSEWDLYEDGSKGRILKYKFFEERMSESSIFKIPETANYEILTYSGLKNHQDEFFSMYLKNNFTGLLFQEL